MSIRPEEVSGTVAGTLPKSSSRITTIDVTRGLVMVIMALDHVRDLFHISAMDQDPTNLSTTTPILFFTRWITHLCAPTFVFLSGTSGYLSLRRRNTPEARGFLFRRGLMLILFELTIINFGFWFEFPYRSMMLQVIFAIGGGLAILSFLARLPIRWIGALGLLIVFGHDLLLLIPPFTDPLARFGWALFFRTDFFPVSPDFALLVGYPLIPWLGIMLLGYAIGPLFEQPITQRRKRLVGLGVGALALFVVVRFVNVYGDQAPWSAQRDGLLTLLSFINVSKYPPSLLYSLLFPGIALLVLAAADGVSNWVTRILTVYGAVPMFYYILHWYLIHLLMLVMVVLQGYSLNNLNDAPFTFGRPKGAGVSLEIVYLVWLGVVLALYPLCRWYGQYKAANPQKGWLRYV